jgi:hypothetical protein
MCRESENPNEKDMKRKIEIEMKLKEIATEDHKSFHQSMSSGRMSSGQSMSSGRMSSGQSMSSSRNQQSINVLNSGDMSALLYDDFVDLTMYKTPASGSWDKALLFVRKTYPEHLILQQMNKVPNEHGFVSSALSPPNRCCSSLFRGIITSLCIC